MTPAAEVPMSVKPPSRAEMTTHLLEQCALRMSIRIDDEKPNVAIGQIFARDITDACNEGVALISALQAANAELLASHKWQRQNSASAAVAELADLLRPRLGGWCSQIGMTRDGKRFAFVFDQPSGAKDYWWMELSDIPAGDR